MSFLIGGRPPPVAAGAGKEKRARADGDASFKCLGCAPPGQVLAGRPCELSPALHALGIKKKWCAAAACAPRPIAPGGPRWCKVSAAPPPRRGRSLRGRAVLVRRPPAKKGVGVR